MWIRIQIYFRLRLIEAGQHEGDTVNTCNTLPETPSGKGGGLKF